eukprot:CAMPEP_0118673110 /NCGR_PEP_ID=MMETSP0800-20121206/135_1 /TAXON_ID=210618 ORGANISM="Striatella unipunctata, Strain CCMP2910" /NCGR_SAMPLE_ID=MMETSP0800 /ASSEMBLY_ACC=CAM_ASM_000638 /LENGTH=484 /DNA_ID=CAMNT_0006568127 /DNA_START=41 /DNA_END=1496 /DNA_ORIENTATION=+
MPKKQSKGQVQEFSNVARKISVDGETLLSIPLVSHHLFYPTSLDGRRLVEGISEDLRKKSRYNQRELAEGNTDVSPLYQGYGTHYFDIWVGSPPQRQTVIIDTGSTVTAFPCSKCQDCGENFHTDKVFNENASSTYEATQCSECRLGSCSNPTVNKCFRKMSYAEGSSWAAIEGKDVAYVGGHHDKAQLEKEKFMLNFGCQYSMTGLFKTQLADGIAGMMDSPRAVWRQMADQAVLPKKQFSLCFAHQSHASKSGTSAGALTLGGMDVRLHQTPMIYMDYKKASAGWFSVRIENIFLRTKGGISVVAANVQNTTRTERVDADNGPLNGNGEIIVDSGTTETYLYHGLEEPFKKAWKEVTKTNFMGQTPMRISKSQVKELPTILVQIQATPESNEDGIAGLAGDLDPKRPKDIIWAIPPTNYMELEPFTHTYICRFYFSEVRGGVLGANAMMGHDVMFDVENTRIGIAESSCDYSSLDAKAKSTR